MKKLAVVLGVAAVASFTGCKDPDYVGRNSQTTGEAKSIETESPVAAPSQQAKPAAQPIAPIEAPKCMCLPGTKHLSPCACGASDCRCIVVPPAPPAPEYTVYIVQNGDFLAKISKKYNVTINSIKRLNNMKSDVVRVGQKLKLPGRIDVGVQSVPSVAAPAAKSSRKGYQSYTGATKEYVVKNGDTLGGIAYGNGMNIRQLKELNSLTKDSIHVGQKLKVAAGGAASAKKDASVKPAKAAKPAAEKKEAAPKEAEKKAAPAEKPVEAAAVEAKPAESAADEKPAAEGAAKPEAPAEAPAPTQTYVVQEGDDLTRIAIDFGLTPTQVRELNNLSETDVLKPGQTIRLPADVQ